MPARACDAETLTLSQEDTQRLKIVPADAGVGGKRLNAGEPGQEWQDGPTAAKKQRTELSSNPVFAAAASRSHTPAEAAAANEKAAVKKLPELLSSSLKEEHLKFMAEHELRRLTDNPTLALGYTVAFGDKAKWQEHFNTRRVRHTQQQQRQSSKGPLSGS